MKMDRGGSGDIGEFDPDGCLKIIGEPADTVFSFE